MKKILLSLLCVACLLGAFAINSPAFSRLLISPLYIVMEGRDRSSQMTLVNISDRRITYRMGWEQVEQAPELNGAYKDTDMSQGGPYLQNFAVFSPRQVTLEPNEKQAIRMAVRRPADLPEGEYKSHLKMEALPSDGDTYADKPGQGQVSFRVNVNMSYSVPIVYRVGEYDIDLSLGSPHFQNDGKDGTLNLYVPVTRSGKHGALGQIDVYHTPIDGEEKLISQLGNANIFPEISNREFKVPLFVKGLQPGKLRIVFLKAEGSKQDYVVLDEETINITN